MPQARVIFVVAIYTGLRQGELWGLHWSDVHLTGSQAKLTVRYSYDGPTKSKKIRHVPLFGVALKALESWRTLCTKCAEGLVFPTVTGCRRPESDDAGWADRVGKKEKGHAWGG